MPNYSKRLDTVSNSGPPPEIEITEQDFELLEGVYGQALSEKARVEIGRACNSYLRGNAADHNAQTYTDVRALLGPVQKAVEQFHLLAFGTLTPITDAGNFLETSLEDHMAEQSGIALQLGDVEKYDGESFVELSADAPMRLRLSFRLLTAVAHQLHYAVRQTENEIDRRVSDPNYLGWTPGGSFREWLLAMQNLAEKHGLSGGSYTSTDKEGDKKKPTKFAEFLFALNKLFPDQHRTEVKTGSAMAERIKDANERAKKVKKASGG